MARRIDIITGLLLLLAIPACAQAPGNRDAAAARVTPAQFRGLRWIEGTWRGRMPDGKYFYERYTHLNDSTIRMVQFADSTLGALSEQDSIALRGGVLLHGQARAIRFDATGIDFAAPPRTTPQFTFAPVSGGGWTATIHPARAGAPPVVYRMEPFAPARPATPR